MTNHARRSTIAAMGAALGAAALPMRAAAQDAPVRIGYAISRTGPFSAGAHVSQEPNYILWSEQVNAAGGLDVKGKRRRVELIGYDDRSEIETASAALSQKGTTLTITQGTTRMAEYTASRRPRVRARSNSAQAGSRTTVVPGS